MNNNIKTLEWRGWTFRAKNTNLLILDVWNRTGMSYEKIGEIFHVSRQTIKDRLDYVKDNHPDLWDIAKKRVDFYIEIEEYFKECLNFAEVAYKFNISIPNAKQIIKTRCADWKKIELKGKRSDHAAEIVFGPKYQAGLNFIDYIVPHIKSLKNPTKERLLKYILTEDDPHSAERFYRKRDFTKLTDLIIKVERPKIEDLREKGVICLRKL